VRYLDTVVPDPPLFPADPADFQVLSGVRVLLEFVDLGELVEGGPGAAAARRLFPKWIGLVPRGLPALS